MIENLIRGLVIGFTLFGFYNFLDLIAKKYGKSRALIVTLIFGVIAVFGLIMIHS